MWGRQIFNVVIGCEGKESLLLLQMTDYGESSRPVRNGLFNYLCHREALD